MASNAKEMLQELIFIEIRNIKDVGLEFMSNHLLQGFINGLFHDVVLTALVM
jgi:hypothetical protein